ncbi:PREDICTED: ecto-ADP-ribosyltransferase 4 [Dipodomys ordii]|uniref:NAD(P)(+)--arginine ADP-ribosyltransferase n=1 Tax=Dipodomys ordii TaxID=10020 RepID=A0A1S3FVF3_DIPOR|nr:PREDICTED: ecto-ADP-ribosyltransferase 4 [Dipodomys ordii]
MTPTGSPEVIRDVDVDLAPGSFDDQYHGCQQQVMEALTQRDYFTREVDAHRNYSRLWHRAHLAWLGHARPLPPGLTPTHAVALLLYMSDATVRSDFSRALARDASSGGQHQRAFRFNFLHYYLTSAVQLLRAEAATRDGGPCHRVHHAMRDVTLEADVGVTVRLGQFLLAPLLSEEAQRPGVRTLLTLITCLGARVPPFSPQQAVLVPPYEVFRVVNRSQHQSGDRWFLRSAGNRSAYNCQLLKASGAQPAPPALLLASIPGLVSLRILLQEPA